MLITAVFFELGVGWGGTTELIQVEPADLELGRDGGRQAVEDLGSPFLPVLSETHSPSCTNPHFPVSFWVILSMSGH